MGVCPGEEEDGGGSAENGRARGSEVGPSTVTRPLFGLSPVAPRRLPCTAPVPPATWGAGHRPAPPRTGQPGGLEQPPASEVIGSGQPFPSGHGSGKASRGAVPNCHFQEKGNGRLGRGGLLCAVPQIGHFLPQARSSCRPLPPRCSPPPHARPPCGAPGAQPTLSSDRMNSEEPGRGAEVAAALAGWGRPEPAAAPGWSPPQSPGAHVPPPPPFQHLPSRGPSPQPRDPTYNRRAGDS